jgi:hypothetical protein
MTVYREEWWLIFWLAVFAVVFSGEIYVAILLGT